MTLAQLFSHLSQVLAGTPLDARAEASLSELADGLAAADATLCVGFRPHTTCFPKGAAAVCLAHFTGELGLYAWLEYGDPTPPAGAAALVGPVFELKVAA